MTPAAAESPALCAFIFLVALLYSSSLWPMAAAALMGGLLGSQLGARRLSTLFLRRLLGAVLLVAACKLAAGASGR